MDSEKILEMTERVKELYWVMKKAELQYDNSTFFRVNYGLKKAKARLNFWNAVNEDYSYLGDRTATLQNDETIIFNIKKSVDKKIAVFCNSIDNLKELKYTPKSMFVRISNEDDLDGIKFFGIIAVGDYWKDEAVLKAMEILRVRQPDIFSEENK